jgi:hypothetical protein
MRRRSAEPARWQGDPPRACGRKQRLDRCSPDCKGRCPRRRRRWAVGGHRICPVAASGARPLPAITSRSVPIAGGPYGTGAVIYRHFCSGVERATRTFWDTLTPGRSTPRSRRCVRRPARVAPARMRRYVLIAQRQHMSQIGPLELQLIHRPAPIWRWVAVASLSADRRDHASDDCYCGSARAWAG